MLHNTNQQKTQAAPMTKQIRMECGNRDYILSLHFKKETDVTFDEKIKKIMQKEVNNDEF